MKNSHLFLICAIIFAISVFFPQPSHQAAIRIKGATKFVPRLFDNGHIISQATLERLILSSQKSGLDRYTNLQNFLHGIDKTDQEIRIAAGLKSNVDPYPTREIHSLIVGSTKEVHDAFLPGNAVQVKDPQGRATNLWETKASFPVLNIYRDKKRNFESLKMVNRQIAAGVVNGRPVHYQAQYIRPVGPQPDYEKDEVTVYEAQQINDGQGTGNRDGSGRPGGGDGSGGLGMLGSGNTDKSDSAGGHGGSDGSGSGNLQMGLSSFGQGSWRNSLNSGMSYFGSDIPGYKPGSGMGSFGTNGGNLAVPLALLNSFYAANLQTSSSNVSPWLPLIVPKGWTGK